MDYLPFIRISKRHEMGEDFQIIYQCLVPKPVKRSLSAYGERAGELKLGIQIAMKHIKVSMKVSLSLFVPSPESLTHPTGRNPIN